MSNTKRRWTGFVAVLLLVMVCAPQFCPANGRRWSIEYRPLALATNRHELTQTVAEYETTELYERLTICDYLASNFLTTNKLRWCGATEGIETTHDLGMEIGRAAYVIERLTRKPISAVSDSTSPVELAKYKDRITEAVSRWRSAEVARELSTKHLPDRESLRSKYSGKIVPGLSTNFGTVETWLNMIALLREWFPIGQSAADLTFIVGSPPTVVKDQEIAYVFHDGNMDINYRFPVVDGMIQSVLIGGTDLGLWSPIEWTPLARALGRVPADLFLMPVTNAAAEGSALAEAEARDWDRYLLSENVRTTNAVKATFQRRAAETYAEYEALAVKYGHKAAWERTGMDKLSQYDVVSFTYKVGGRTVVTKQTRWMWMALFQGEGTDGKSSSELAPMITSIAANCFNSYTNHDFGRFYGPDPPGTPMFMSGTTNEIDSGVTDWRDDVRATVHADTIAFYGPKQKQDYRTNSSLRVPMDEESNREWFDDNGIAVKDRGKGKDSKGAGVGQPAGQTNSVRR